MAEDKEVEQEEEKEVVVPNAFFLNEPPVKPKK